jgi:hypothetical protein
MIDTERFKEAVLAVCEVEIDLTELIQNIQVNGDGNFESSGRGIEVVLSPEYEIISIAGGISPEQNRLIINTERECDM